jgi:hypothetical protein
MIIRMDTNLPDWMSPQLPALSEEQRQLLLRQVEQQTFEAAFEHIVEEVENGRPLHLILEDDPRKIHLGRFRRWIRKNPDRARRFQEAEETMAYMIETEMLKIADGTDNLEDVKRSELRLNTRWRLLEIYHKERYRKDGDTSGSTPVINVTISGYDNPITIDGSMVNG